MVCDVGSEVRGSPGGAQDHLVFFPAEDRRGEPVGTLSVGRVSLVADQSQCRCVCACIAALEQRLLAEPAVERHGDSVEVATDHLEHAFHADRPESGDTLWIPLA